MLFSDTFPLDSDGNLPAVKWSKPVEHTPVEGETFGVPTGSRNGFWVLDLDRKNGKDGLTSLTEYIQAGGYGDLPDTYTVRTRTGGYHFYWSLPPDPQIGNRTGVLLGVDVRGNGGFVRAGEGYDVLLEVPPTQAPEWLIDLCKPKTAGAAPISAIAISPEHPEFPMRIANAERYLADEPACVEGNGGDRQLWLVCLKLARTYELPTDVALKMLESYNARCQPPWSVDAMVRKLTEAATKGTSIPGTFASGFMSPPSAPQAADAVASPSEDWRQRPNPEHAYSWSLTDIRSGYDKQTPITQADLASMFIGPSAHPDWAGVWQYDDFNRRIIAINPPLALPASEKGAVLNVDLGNIGLWLASRVGSKASREMLSEAIASAASAASFHPVRQYLEGLPEKVPVILKSAGTARFLFGCSEAEAPRAIEFVRKWLIGAIARVMRPGCKFDTVLTLAGAVGGERKSLFFSTLAIHPEWSRSGIPGIDEPQKCGLAVRGRWIVEMAELADLKRSEAETFKDYVTRQSEQFRSPYDRCEVDEPRQFAIGATTNNLEFLDRLDLAIQRRFWPIHVTARIPIEWVTEHRDELWAEAFACYRAGELWYYDNERELDETRAHFEARTPIQESLLGALATPSVRALMNGKSATDITRIMLERVPTKAEVDEVAKSLKDRAGITKKRIADGRRLYTIEPLEGTAGAVVVPFFNRAGGA